MRMILAVALTAVLALPPLAPAQTTDGEVTTTQDGPKRIRVPGADEEGGAETAAEPAGEEGTTIEMLPEAGAEAETAPASEQGEIEVFPEGEAIAEPDAEPAESTEAETVQSEPTADPAPTEAVPAAELGTGPFVGDYTIGDAQSPVQVIEYASLTCPHCAAFHRDAWPQFKEEYVDTGEVGFTLREVYFDRYGLWASMTARCAGEAGFYPMVNQFLTKQDEWTRADDIAAAIQQIGRRAGLGGDQLKACLENQDFAKLLVEDYQANAAADEISSTPTFVISGPGGTKTVPGNMAYEEFRELVEEVSAGS